MTNVVLTSWETKSFPIRKNYRPKEVKPVSLATTRLPLALGNREPIVSADARGNARGRKRGSGAFGFQPNWYYAGERLEKMPKRLRALIIFAENYPDKYIDRDLYKLLLEPNILHLSYQYLKVNQDKECLKEELKKEWVQETITSLKDESFQFKVAAGDRIVQEAIRLVLEIIYEPMFNKHSHGYRPGKNCHSALFDISSQMHSSTWVIEGNIKGSTMPGMIKLLGNKIKDERFLRLIQKALKAGYAHYSLLSPLLTNIYLHQLDIFLSDRKNEFEKSTELHQLRKNFARYDKPYNNLTLMSKLTNKEAIKVNKKVTELGAIPVNKLGAIAVNELVTKQVKDIVAIAEKKLWAIPVNNIEASPVKANIQANLATTRLTMLESKQAQARQLRKEQKDILPIKVRTILEEIDANNISYPILPKSLSFVRYADEWLVGISGTHEDARRLKEEIDMFLQHKLAVTPNVSKITNWNKDRVLFLGALISRSYSYLLFEAPITLIRKQLTEAGFIKKAQPTHKSIWIKKSLQEIFALFNSVFFRYVHFYHFAANQRALSSFLNWVLWLSCARTLAAKHCSSVKNILPLFQKYKKYPFC